MPISEAKKKANRKWDEAHRSAYWRATIVFPVEEKQEVLNKAEAKNMTISEYIRSLIKADTCIPAETDKQQGETPKV